MSATLETAAGHWTLSGELDFDTVPGLLAQSTPAFDPQQPLTVDLGAVRRSNSAGLALLLEWMRWSAQAGSSIRFQRLPDSLRRVAGIGGLELPEADASQD